MGQDKEGRYDNNQQTKQGAQHNPEASTLQKQTGVRRMADNAVRTGLHNGVIVAYGHVYRKKTAQVHDGPPAQRRAGSKQTCSKPLPSEADEQLGTHVA